MTDMNTTTTNENTRILRLALLVNDTPVQPVVEAFGGYSVIYKRWLELSKPSNSDNVTFTLKPFDVVNQPGIYPNPEDYDGIILTGSG